MISNVFIYCDIYWIQEIIKQIIYLQQLIGSITHYSNDYSNEIFEMNN